MTRRHGGTGLGLTRCHQLVTMMGGSITADSTPGFGSAFTFTITFEEPEATQRGHLRAAGSPTSQGRTPRECGHSGVDALRWSHKDRSVLPRS